jgi:hypothetical protein
MASNFAFNLFSDNRQSTVQAIPPEQLDAIVRPYKEHTETQQRFITHLEQKLQINHRQLIAVLQLIEEIPSELRPAKLAYLAERVRSLTSTPPPMTGDSLTIDALKSDAQEAIRAGAWDKADALLADAELEQQQAFHRLSVVAADTSARRGELALIRSQYGEAARHYADAAAALPWECLKERTQYLMREAFALHTQGVESKDSSALLSALDRYERLAATLSRVVSPSERMLVLDHLGAIVRMLKMQEGESGEIVEALSPYREALNSEDFWTLLDRKFSSSEPEFFS